MRWRALVGLLAAVTLSGAVTTNASAEIRVFDFEGIEASDATDVFHGEGIELLGSCTPPFIQDGVLIVDFTCDSTVYALGVRFGTDDAPRPQAVVQMTVAPSDGSPLLTLAGRAGRGAISDDATGAANQPTTLKVESGEGIPFNVSVLSSTVRQKLIVEEMAVSDEPVPSPETDVVGYVQPNTRQPLIEFGSDQPYTTFICRLDGVQFTPCTVPAQLRGLTEGEHEFSVQAKGVFGDVDPSPARVVWTTDVTAPAVTAATGPGGTAELHGGDPITVAFNETMEPGSLVPTSFVLKAAGEATVPVAVRASAMSAVLVPSRTLTPGATYDLAVAGATDAAGNAVTATHRTLRTAAAPITTFTDAPAARVNTAGVSFTFRAEVPSSFTCQLDTQVAATCASPKTYPTISSGAHSLIVRATSRLRDANATGTMVRWFVDRTPPVADAGLPAGANPQAVPTSATFPVTFSEAMRPATITAARFALNGPGGKPVPIRLTITSPTAVTVIPAAPLAPATDYELVVTTGPQDEAGNATVATTRRTFRTNAAAAPPATPPEPTPPTTTTPEPDPPVASTPPAGPVQAPGPPQRPQSDGCGPIDTDGDGIHDLCDVVGRPGSVPAVVGESVVVKVLSGEVFIRLGAAPAALSATRLANEPGFVPLKGVSNVPVGSSLDTRGGQVEVTTATASAAPGAAAAKQYSGKLSAAIFQIRQRRAARKTKKHPRPAPSPTQLLLQTPSTTLAAKLCAQKGSTAAVRSLGAVVPKGVFQFVGAASTVTTTSATANIRTTDRCDGTYTEVGGGTARIVDARRHRTVTVRSGAAYLARGRFLTLQYRKGR